MQFYLMTVYMLSVAAYAMLRGGQPERSVALLLAGTSAIDFVYHLLCGPPRFEHVEAVHLVIDSGVLAALLWIALHANRGWPLWACSAQLIVMLGHVAKLMEVREVFRGYWAITQFPFLLQLTVLFIGTSAHVARFRHVGPYHGWRAG